MIQSTDFFYPLIDDAFLMGRVTCANVLSDLFAIGVTQIDSLNIIMSACEQMTPGEQQAVIPTIIAGMKSVAMSADIKNISLNQIVINPWCMIGGTATAIVTEKEFISPINAQVGDYLILTKPLGGQIACLAQIRAREADKWENLKKHFTQSELHAAHTSALDFMMTLNKDAAELMHKYNCHAATDVTGYGILGHAQNLAKYQKNNVKFILHTMPVIKNVLKMAEAMGMSQKLLRGSSPETSGGLLISINKDCIENFREDLVRMNEEANCWIVGIVEEGDRTAELSQHPNIIEV
ncbi:PREDICTED: selenide, water dikinase-like [Nicrophorus vespilloides]|uniref:Selenide, water dikinase-like n=1 Tax=Nicrophorus vespilloides TaxID=110193 RepID=A0ABM1NF52_NICVS|nr:PREDICTED: selenide, water dikinase-like [Nicrophorus vespilloides]